MLYVIFPVWIMMHPIVMPSTQPQVQPQAPTQHEIVLDTAKLKRI